MIKSVRFLLLLIAFVSMQIVAWGQPQERLVQVQVTPDHTNWLYKPGEKVKFKVAVLKCNIPQDNLEVRYEISEDMMKPHQTGKQPLKNEKLEINAGTMKKEGFLRCRAFVTCQGREYEGVATVGFSPEKLQPTTPLPADFLEFWKSTKEAAEKWALEPIMTLLPERCTDKVNVYHVSFANNDYASRMYGILCVPKASGKYPAILKVPGAGIRAYNGEAERAGKGFIILEIGVRAIDFIYTLPEFNGNLATFGGSQGGALSIVIAGLDDRVKGLVSFYPALCDMAGYAHGRAGGWPHLFKDAKNRTPEKMKTVQYFDVVNFARQVKVPGFYTFGYNDMVCPPTTTYSAYNVINAPKELFVAETTAHYAYAEQWSAAWNWVMNFLKNKSK